jgi:CRISPR-associated protein Cas1
MRLQDLHDLPKVRDSLGYLYVEHCRVDQEAKAIAIHDQFGVTPVPCASLMLLMLGPGTKITHAAILTLADNNCLVAWCGEQGVRFYAAGTGATRGAARLLRQATLATRRSTRLEIVRRLYEMRFAEPLDPDLSLQQIRGMEGMRVRKAYGDASAASGVPWAGRNYDRSSWKAGDPVNRALSAANSCLYGVCHAAIVAAGYSPALGFIHTGKQLSFVYDVADLYKVELTIPVAFEVAGAGVNPVERETRLRCRDAFARLDLLGRVVKDIERALDVRLPEEDVADFDADPALPGGLWDPEQGTVKGGENYGNEE